MTLKRAFDLFASFVALLLLSPILIATAAVVRWRLGSPVLFRQVRPGLHGQPFTLCKFRTMTGVRDANGQVLADDARTPPIGRTIRSLSLDEWPQLLNILRGEMSLVGPRPLLMEYLPLYTARQQRRHDVLPGITGWSQINGRAGLSWEEKLELDAWYVDHQSFWLDLKILARTVWMVIRREDIFGPGNVRFTGSGARRADL